VRDHIRSQAAASQCITRRANFDPSPRKKNENLLQAFHWVEKLTPLESKLARRSAAVCHRRLHGLLVHSALDCNLQVPRQCCFLFCLLRAGYQLALEGGAVDVEYCPGAS
jgi:hypothetical protein